MNKVLLFSLLVFFSCNKNPSNSNNQTISDCYMWGTNVEDIGLLLNTDLIINNAGLYVEDINEFSSELSTGPAMYYSANSQSVLEEHAFKIKIKNVESEQETIVNDYNYIRDRYFFIDNQFKINFYPLNDDHNHIYNPNYVIYKLEVFRRVSPWETIQPGSFQGIAYLDPSDAESYSESGGVWVRLQEGVDYEANRLSGYIRFNEHTTDVIGIAYEIGQYGFDFGYSQYSEDSQIPTYTIFYDQHLENLDFDSNSRLIMKLIKSEGISTPNSPTWPLMFKNVYSLDNPGINLNNLELEIVYIGNILEETHSQINSQNSFLNLFGLDVKDQNGNNASSGDGIIDYQWVNDHGELFFPTHLPFAYQQDCNE